MSGRPDPHRDLRKGWCPGALRPMAARDGLLVRLRITGGLVSVPLARAIADLAQHHGNGLLDLSARANLQLRGVRESSLPALWSGLASLGLLDADAEAEAVRNVLASPLAGVGDHVDIRPLVTALEVALVSEPALRRLPSKFGVLIDDDGGPSLAGIAADLRFDWLAAERAFGIGLGGTAADAMSLGLVSPTELVERAMSIALRVVSVPGEPRRPRTLMRERGRDWVAAWFGAAEPPPAPVPPTPLTVGQQSVRGIPVFGLAVPFGRLDATMLRDVARLVEAGWGELRLTPWRTILVPHVVPAHSDLARMAEAGLIVDAADPRLRVAACTGRHGCERGTTDTHADAARLASFAATLQGDRVALHVSGCTKGCARPEASAVTLVGRDGRYDLVRDGRPGDEPLLTGLDAKAVDAALRPTGRLSVVGLGPGHSGWVTPEAAALVAEATDLVGYAPYLARLAVLPHQTIHASDNRVEVARARDALALAAAGRRVAVVSGGDPGIFAMAAAVFEAIEAGEPTWRGVEVMVSPGVSAMQAAAARLGAPLGHDFCAISLSDNLKPWPLVARRLRAAADGDFVIALYNPASRARPRQIFDAFALLRETKAHATPVAFARAIGRSDERVVVTTLGEADPGMADMATLVLIGSSQTRLVVRPGGTPWVYTPRHAAETLPRHTRDGTHARPDGASDRRLDAGLV